VTRISYLDTARGLLTRRDSKEFLFFTRTPNGRGAAKAFLARLEEPTKNTVDLDRRLPNSRLVLYPDAGHGGVFQFHEDFVQRALEFL